MTSQGPPSYRHVDDAAAEAVPRNANIVLGAWLFGSAFVWPHPGASFTNTWVVGVLILGFALGALAAPALRWANAALAVWLILTTSLLWPATPGTLWNNVIIGVLVFVLSSVPAAIPPTGGASAGPM
jgi:hypothetical protein